ncbi:MAG TPA: phosphate ABC transporter ATP-binding protein PstB [Candidatus Syntrophosphaera thermopropionivorans]|jgi:phosphate transport system ATP-binding protein|nr:phosphate ABC transporter ATP-binding protein [Candidatus Syntrophosphaera sp.]HOH82168.1 phosphate ABC transporter ATP-binding protein PstB [Candidatus Syntrophosphaera thermopropionivorans]MBP7932507.1 phosphate ABC transporter ATP-binding protein [Candidatus Syntrophosphaera sp.]MBP9006519.1 phosphate ABC transporter ATP-binding protein [Candidatus Syntrophosphaera sp.]HOJ42223.1 phosphate ABC transporter ATP-binding protein PstB [Candidatus Syntrophosphaera thermopropionivorans]
MVEKQIWTSNLNLWFGKNHILHNINLEAYKNNITAIIGPSGCGKSTLLRCFNRMNDLIPDMELTGKVYLGSKDIYAPKTDVYAVRASVGMVFQKPNPFPKSIYHNVAYGLQIQAKYTKSEIKERVEESLKAAWLWDEVKDRLHHSAMSLSGGQQQRLCIARALANKPQVLLLDEPTSALDPQSTAKIEELCLSLKNSVTILMVTHNVAQAGRISDYTAFLYLGELVEFGKTEHIFTVPKDKRTEEYLTGVFG